MARLWSDSGVVRGVGSEINFWGWVDGAPGTVALGDGAVWVNGFYGHTDVGKWLVTPGDDGMVMAVFDPYLEEVRLQYEPGLHGDMDRFNEWDRDHYWMMALWELNGFGNVVDRREFVPNPRQEPPLVEVPAWVPRPFARSWTGAGQVDVSTSPVNVWALHFAADPAFVPGRNYRVTFYLNSPFFRQGANWGGPSTCVVQVWDAKGERPGSRPTTTPWRRGPTSWRPAPCRWPWPTWTAGARPW